MLNGTFPVSELLLSLRISKAAPDITQQVSGSDYNILIP